MTAKPYVNKLAVILDIDLRNLYRKLKELEKEGILKSTFEGRERYFSLNQSYPYLKEYRTIFLKTFGLERTLKEKLSHIKGVGSVYIFGSYAKNTMNVSSDIDLLVVGEHSIIELQREINSIQKAVNREINVINIGIQEFNQKIKKKDRFLSNILNNTHIKVI